MEEYTAGDTVRMKKKHPCGENRWRIIRIGMDVKLECEGCHRIVALKRSRFNKSVERKLT